MTVAPREAIKRTIASILDHPSVYMGGPSRGNLRRAERIMEYLDDEKLLRIEGESPQ